MKQNKEKNISKNKNELDFKTFLANAQVVLVDDARSFDINKWEDEVQKEMYYELNCSKETTWPANLLDDIFGYSYDMDKETADKITNSLKNNKDVEKVLDEIFNTMEEESVKFIKNYYMYGLSIEEIAKENKKSVDEIYEIQNKAMRYLINPKRAKLLKPFCRL